jgi:hypothetical protein
LRGFCALRRAENTRNVSEAILGCLSPRDLRRTGVRAGRLAEKLNGEWVEKNKVRKERHVRWRAEVEVLGA